MARSLFLLALASLALAQNTATAPSDVYAAQATAKSSSPVSFVPGLAFDRFITIWLENTDFEKAKGDPNLAALAKQGVALSNYFGVTHPSEPNYMASVAGDNFGNDNDAFNKLPANVSSIVDLLEARGISWGEYQEDMPYAGFGGYAWPNQKTGANDYVYKHSPLMTLEANSKSARRLSQMKNLTGFYDDLAAHKLPQWSFITPNMTSDGHDTSVTTAGTWTSNFLTPLLKNEYFMRRTLILVTFDENHTYSAQNRVFSILLGGAVPPSLHGTTDSTFYNHYSELSSVQANWHLDTLGRWDVGANVFDVVARHTLDRPRSWDAVTGATPTVFLNQSYPGYLNSVNSSVPIPKPNIHLVRNTRIVSPLVQLQWARSDAPSIYKDTVEIPDAMHIPAGY
ncbi:hypothetical protein FH972_022070 [Carpinus fangiana]|uniref:Acid phosphatase n=1 Tax=Carpinus fangiana TaxID=176857 RepID=A0A5N6KRT4_9ROSI|nr:hypothetical protein FH972_022070 [Carpinus fangiana]